MAQRVAPNWKGGYTCSQGDITRPMGNRLHSGLHHKPGRTSRALWEINFPKEEADALTVEIQGMLEKQAISRVPREQEAKGFISSFSLFQKGGREETNNQFRRTKYICGEGAFQNGENPYKGHPKTRRLDDKGRLEGCLHHDFTSNQSEAAGAISMAEGKIPSQDGHCYLQDLGKDPRC